MRRCDLPKRMGEQEPSVRDEYEGAELSDRRLNARLQTMAGALEAKPDAGFPNAMTEAKLEAIGRS